MAKIRITRRFHFEMAHALQGYEGLCRNIHGHSYHLEITVNGNVADRPGDPDDGMLMDFHNLKALVKTCITDQFDHALMINRNTPAGHSTAWQDITERLIMVDFQPTTENLVTYIARLLIPLLPEGINLFCVRLFETENSFAEWYASDNEQADYEGLPEIIS